MTEHFNTQTLIGEATGYDKKQALEVKKPKSWLKSVSAFANGMGGKLIFGVADDDTLVGLADAKGDAEKISEAIKSHLDPIPEFNLSFAKTEGKEFVLLTVMPGTLTPYYYIGDGHNLKNMYDDVHYGDYNDDSVQGGVQGVQGGVQGNAIELNDKQKEVLNFCSVPQSASDILAYLNLSQHSKNRKTYVTLLVNAGLLAMTIPDKPNDMRQKYIRTDKPIL